MTDVEALWERSAEHDLVVVATPNRFHVPLGLAALEAGLPVVIDKPMAPDRRGGPPPEDRRGRTGSVPRCLPEPPVGRGSAHGAAHRREAFGPIVRFESRFEQWRPAVRTTGRGVDEIEEAGGLLFDLEAILIDQAVGLFGPPLTVYAEVDRRRPGAEVDDDTFVALEHGDGVQATSG